MTWYFTKSSKNLTDVTNVCLWTCISVCLFYSLYKYTSMPVCIVDLTFFLSLMEPFPLTMILHPVSASSCLAVSPRGPKIRPTKLNCNTQTHTALSLTASVSGLIQDTFIHCHPTSPRLQPQCYKMYICIIFQTFHKSSDISDTTQKWSEWLGSKRPLLNCLCRCFTLLNLL